MLGGMGVRDDENGITTGSIAWPGRKNLIGRRWALALARRGCVSWRRALRLCLARPTALAIATILLKPLFLAVGGGPIALTRLPAPPLSRGSATGLTAITNLGVRRRERALTAFQQTATCATRPARLLPCPGKRMQ